jgi:hypothetical protein
LDLIFIFLSQNEHFLLIGFKNLIQIFLFLKDINS